MTTTRNGAPPTWTGRATRPVDTQTVLTHIPGDPACIHYASHVTPVDAPIPVEVCSTANLAFGDDRDPSTLTLQHTDPRILVNVHGLELEPADALELARALVDAVHVATGTRYAVTGPLLPNAPALNAPREVLAATDAGGSFTGLAEQDTPEAACRRAAGELRRGASWPAKTIATHTIRCLALDQFGDTDLDELAREVADRVDQDLAKQVKALGIAGDPGPGTREAMHQAAQRVLDDIADQDTRRRLERSYGSDEDEAALEDGM